jgi:hypothetical protein
VGIEPTCPAWKADTFAARPRARCSLKRKPWDSNPQRDLSRTCFRGRVLSQYGWLPWLNGCGDRNRTCVTTINSRLPVPARTPPQSLPANVVGFEPTVSCSRSTRISRLSYTLIFVRRGSTFPFRTDVPRERKSTQRELNPHFRPGEAAGCRYIMGAITLVELPKSKHSKWDRTGSNRHQPGKNRVCCLANTSIPICFVQ